MTAHQLKRDALVFLGATDPAYKKILPALQEMIKRGALTVQESTPLRHVRARRLDPAQAAQIAPPEGVAGSKAAGDLKRRGGQRS
jgi:hypothetical protein